MRRLSFPLWCAALLALLAIASSLFLAKGTDLMVYYYGVRDFYTGVRSAYGPDSGISHPLEYRYPPPTYVLLYPLPLVSFHAARFLWALLEWVAAVLTVRLAIRTYRLRFSRNAISACCAAMLAYVVLAIRYENVQPFVICGIFAALIVAGNRPLWSGLLLALAITFKIWPILFVPWLFRGHRRKAVYATALWLAALWALPLAVFGVAGYWSLIMQWYVAMTKVAADYSGTYYFLGQSLREVALRCFAGGVSPRIVSSAAEAAGAAIYCVFVAWMLRAKRGTLWVWDGLVFLLYSMVEPYAVKSGLISLGPAILIGACVCTIAGERAPRAPRAVAARTLFLSACAICFLGAILQYPPLLRFLLVAGVDLWAEMLLLAAFTLWLLPGSKQAEPGPSLELEPVQVGDTT